MTSGRHSSLLELSSDRRRLLGLLAADGGLVRQAAPASAGRARSDRARLSFAQERLWFLDRFQPGLSIYNMPMTLRFSGPLDVHALRSALTEIVRRHEVLRTVFRVEQGRPVQVILPAGRAELPHIDLCSRPPEAREAEFNRMFAAEWDHVFDLSEGPLLRTALVRLHEDDHRLLLNLHHIISDGWSSGILLREISTLYHAYADGRPSPLPELPLQYGDFAEQQRRRLSGERLETLLEYWRGQLRNAPASVDLPTDRPRPALQTFHGALQFFTIPRGTADALIALERECNATRFMVLLAAFKVLLYRYTGQRDLVVGTPIANRNRPEVEGLIGFFVNTLVLRTRVEGTESFEELLRRVRETTLDAYAHQDLPFEKLVEELQPERNLSRHPLFQVLFALQNTPTIGRRSAASAGGGADRFTPTTAKFDLGVFLGEGDDGLAGEIEYNTDLFDHATITRLIGHFRTLLESIAAEPQAPLASLPLLTPAERRQILVEWNETGADYPRERCIHELFEAQAARTPDATAVIFEDRSLEYAELNRRANRLARYLRGIGVGPGVRVAVCLERSLDMVVGVLGILKAGGTYVPLDPSYPQARLAFMLEDCRARVLLTQPAVADELRAAGARRVTLDGCRSDLEGCSAADLPPAASADEAAYVVYTSGSTGRPKGVAMPHRALVNLVSWQTATSAPGAGAVTLQYAPFSFDVFAQEAFATWAAGGALLLVSNDTRVDFGKLLSAIERHAVTRSFLPPVALQALARTAVLRARWPKCLREIITAGEQLRIDDDVRTFFGNLDGCSLRNQYGPAESHVVTELRLEGSPATWPDRPGIGRPIANARIYVLDSRLEPVPIGGVGCLHIAGPSLARGYVDRPALTAERFLPDPYGGEPGERMYCSGDLARLTRDGNIEFIGRSDRQVKIRGFRIEPGEVESALCAHPDVAHCVVASARDSRGDTRLVGYFVAKPGRQPAERDLLTFVAQHLPSHMLPSVLVRLERVPLLPSGKVDLAALPEVPDAEPRREARLELPADTLEAEIAAIWSDVLRLEDIGMLDNFFELGGHSLIATQVVSRIEAAFGVEVPVRAIFDAPTVRGLAAALRAAESSLSGAGAGVKGAPSAGSVSPSTPS